jgi:2-keto-4-pentenoate hydratase/2-oxohepta-3-ene-1,7-dioic acid hydratase in catechol pathway
MAKSESGEIKMLTRRGLVGRSVALTAASSLASNAAAQAAGSVNRYVRFRSGNATASWGRVTDATISVLSAAPWANPKETGKKVPLAKAKLLAPVQASKLLAVGLNYKSHIGNRPVPTQPEIFYKPITCLQDPGEPIIIPSGALNVHYEGEIVFVLGKGGRNLNRQQATDAIFGVTCGNDVSERDWQNGPQKDLQWWRAKGSDTFGPAGPMLVQGLNYSNLLLQTRLNGEVVQKQNTSDLLFDGPAIVSYLSQYITLAPGYVIYSGTPGSTKKMKPGDVVEVELENVGILTNPIRA